MTTAANPNDLNDSNDLNNSKEAIDPFFNPLDPNFARDPYPHFRSLRERSPVLWSKAMNAWIITGFEPLVTAMRDPRLSLNPRDWESYEAPTDPALLRLDELNQANFFMLSPADHRRVRKLVSKAFTPRAVAALGPMIEGIVEDCLAKVRSTGRMEIVSQLAATFPTFVISRMLGIPPDSEREKRFKKLSDSVVRLASPMLSMEERIACAPALEELNELVSAVIEERRREPGDDMLSRLIAAEEEGEQLTRDELLTLVPGLIVAGSETTANALALGVREMLNAPDQLALYRERPELRMNAIEELVRIQMPGFYTPRFALEDIELCGTPIRKGQLLLASLSAAHRDPARFADPDRLDITRDLRDSGVFGNGAHRCLGAQLARLEMDAAFTRIFTALPGLRLDCDYEKVAFQLNPTVRSVASLPLVFDAH